MVPVVQASADKTELAYKRKLHHCLRRSHSTLEVGDFFFRRKEHYNTDKKRREKLSTIADGLYKVVFVHTDTLVLDIDCHHELISRDGVYRAPSPNQEPIPTQSNGNDDSVPSSPTATTGLTTLRSSVLPNLHRSVSDLLDSENSTSISPLLSRVIDHHSLRALNPVKGHSSSPGPRYREEKKASNIKPSALPVEPSQGISPPTVIVGTQTHTYQGKARVVQDSRAAVYRDTCTVKLVLADPE